MKGEIILTWMIISSIVGIANAIIGYDCGHRSANITSISLMDIGECDIPASNVMSSKESILLLQINEFDFTRVVQCKVEIDRNVRRCGMFSHTMDVPNGKYSYIEEITRDACMKMHRFGAYKIGDVIITGLHVNQTTSRPVTLAGKLNNDGKCQGVSFSDPYGSWEEVVVPAVVTITLREYTARVKFDSNKLYLKSGVICELNAQNCMDLEGGNTYWETMPLNSCDFSKYGVLYRGLADKITDLSQETQQVVYSLTTDDIVFALTTKSTFHICGYELTRTEHPKLIIFENKKGDLVIPKGKIGTENLDSFTYINSKFVYVEKHMRTQIKQLYKDVLQQQCNLEKQMLSNSLSIAAQTPDVFAYHLMKGPGFMAVTAGEVVHIIKCVPVEVTIKRTKECYTHLPVIKENATYFLTPQTHILQKQGMQISCSILVPPMYKLDDTWYKLTPGPIETKAPTTLKPATTPTWKYVNPGKLATSGIYTEEDLDELRDQIMFPAERPALLNTVARGIVGKSSVIQDGSISNILDEESLNKIAKNTWGKIWSNFTTFGNVSAGVIGIFIIIRTIKLIIDTLIHGYALHTVYGWSLYLIGAIWDSVTHLLLHLSKGALGNTQKPLEQDTIALVPSAPPTLYPQLEETNPRDSQKPMVKESETGDNPLFQLRS